MLVPGRVASSAALLISIAVSLAACQAGPGSAPTASSLPQEPETVTVRMGYLWASSQYYSQYLLCQDAGFFLDNGLEVTISEGQGSGNTVQLIANNQADFGLAVAAGAVIRAVSQDAQVKMLASTTPHNPIAIISQEEDPVRSPDDLVGKRVAIPPGTEQEQLWPAFMTINDLDPSSFEVINIAGDALPAALGQGQIDAYVSYATDIPFLRKAGLDPVAFTLAQGGVSYAPGEGIVTSQRMIDERPDTVRRFVTAVTACLEQAYADPAAAAAAGAKLQPDSITADVAEEELAINNDLIGDDLREGTLFPMTDEEWQGTLDLLTEYAELDGARAPGEYYTNEFLP